MQSPFNTFLLVLAAIFPVVNPPGSALVFLGLTRGVTPEIRRILAWRVARNSFFVLVCSLLLGALILEFYGISIPVLRVAGGFIVAVSGWKLLSEGSQKEAEASADRVSRTDPLDQATGSAASVAGVARLDELELHRGAAAVEDQHRHRESRPMPAENARTVPDRWPARRRERRLAAGPGVAFESHRGEATP
jgi:hypothetical protein